MSISFAAVKRCNRLKHKKGILIFLAKVEKCSKPNRDLECSVEHHSNYLKGQLMHLTHRERGDFEVRSDVWVYLSSPGHRPW